MKKIIIAILFVLFISGIATTAHARECPDGGFVIVTVDKCAEGMLTQLFDQEFVIQALELLYLAESLGMTAWPRNTGDDGVVFSNDINDIPTALHPLFMQLEEQMRYRGFSTMLRIIDSALLGKPMGIGGVSISRCLITGDTEYKCITTHEVKHRYTVDAVYLTNNAYATENTADIAPLNWFTTRNLDITTGRFHDGIDWWTRNRSPHGVAVSLNAQLYEHRYGLELPTVGRSFNGALSPRPQTNYYRYLRFVGSPGWTRSTFRGTDNGDGFGIFTSFN
jgi:hypothetical protein